MRTGWGLASSFIDNVHSQGVSSLSKRELDLINKEEPWITCGKLKYGLVGASIVSQAYFVVVWH